MSGLLHSVSGLLAVLNEHRQIIALNDSFLRSLGIENPEDALGLRHGQAMQCAHAEEEPAGCGTTKFCSTCGAAIAIVSSMKGEVVIERLCAISARRNGKLVDIALVVRSQPAVEEVKKILLVLVHDVTVEQRRAALERAFFHDINNLLSCLMQSSEIVAQEQPGELADMNGEIIKWMQGEVAIQRYLTSMEPGRYRATWQIYNAGKLLEETLQFFSNHPSAKDKHINYEPPTRELLLNTDTSATFRVVCNMVINALEASETGESVKIWIDPTEKEITFCVWNRSEIP